MTAILALVYGFYFVMVGVRGNAGAFLTDLSSEKQFLYWIVILFAIAVLWESNIGEEVAKPFAALIIIGFLLAKSNGVANYTTIFKNAEAILPGIG